MKIAVFSDIHGNYQALKSILNDIKKRKIEKVICLGDNIGLGPSSNECLRLINSTNLVLLAGNHELYHTKGLDEGHVIEADADEHNKWVHSIVKEPVNDKLMKYELKYNNKRILFVHFFLSNSTYPFETSHIFDDDTYKEVFKRYDYDMVVYGHRHEQRIDEYNNHVFYGLDSSGCTKDENTFYYIIDIDKDINVEKVFVKYDRETFVKIIKNTNYPNRGHICDYFFGIKE